MMFQTLSSKLLVLLFIGLASYAIGYASAAKRYNAEAKLQEQAREIEKLRKDNEIRKNAEISATIKAENMEQQREQDKEEFDALVRETQDSCRLPESVAERLRRIQ